MWLSETKRKLILCLILLLALAAVAALILTDRRHTSEQQSRLRTVVEEMKSLEQERDSLEEELAKLDESAPDMPTRTATAQIVVTELWEEVYTSLYPEMKRYGMSGVLALSDELFPGGDGLISREQFVEMIEDSWEYCLFWDGNGELDAWLSVMEEYLALEELTMPEVLYVSSASATWKDDAACLSHGISIVVHRQENGGAGIATSADAMPLEPMDQEPAVPEEVAGKDGEGLEETQNALEETEPANVLPVVPETGEPGYWYSAASASNAHSSVPVSENPIIEPLQVPLTQTAMYDSMGEEDIDGTVWHLESLVWNGQDLAETVSSLAESGGNLTVELQLSFDERGVYQSENITAFLNFLRSGGLELRSFAEAREMMLEYQRSLEEWEHQKEEKRQAIRDQIEELDERIDVMGAR